jgi:hypothetical protein
VSIETDQYGHDQVDTIIDIPDGPVTVSTWRSFFTRAVNQWVYGVHRGGVTLESHVFASRGGRDLAAAQKIAELVRASRSEPVSVPSVADIIDERWSDEL